MTASQADVENYFRKKIRQLQKLEAKLKEQHENTAHELKVTVETWKHVQDSMKAKP